MPYPKGKPLATLKATEILTYLQQHPETLDNTKMHELVVGYLLSQFFSPEELPLMQAGIPLKQGAGDWLAETALSVESIISRGSRLVEDDDIDVFVGYGKNWQGCQITRFVNPRGAKTKKTLASLIEKKCERTCIDPSSILVVSVEDQPHITEKELHRIIGEIDVPFGRILLIMKASEARGHFSYCQVYPGAKLGKEIRVPLTV